jgi:hypothetical protein
MLIGLGGLLVLAIYTFPFWRPLTVSDVVDDPFVVALNALPVEMQPDFQQMATQNPAMAGTMVAAAGINTEVPEDDQAMPDMVDPVIASTGSFIQIDAIHSAEGTATIYHVPDAGRILRFEDFRATNGPELHVLLSVAQDPRSNEELGESFVDLGLLKGNVGNQNYEIPDDVDLSLYQSVVIYSLPFEVVFSTATLSAP